MMSGRDALGGQAMWRWADEGEQWLRSHFGDKLEFSTMVDVEKRSVELKVHRRIISEKTFATGPGEIVFTVTEPVQYFVSHLTVTKIILIAG